MEKERVGSEFPRWRELREMKEIVTTECVMFCKINCGKGTGGAVKKGREQE